LASLKDAYYNTNLNSLISKAKDDLEAYQKDNDTAGARFAQARINELESRKGFYEGLKS